MRASPAGPPDAAKYILTKGCLAAVKDGRGAIPTASSLCTSFSLYYSTYPTISMAKPTLLQALLNRPSQSYTNYAEKEYHSARQEFARAAAASSSSRASTSNVVPGSSQYPRDTVVLSVSLIRRLERSSTVCWAVNESIDGRSYPS